MTKIVNPSQDQLVELALRHTPTIYETEYGNLNKITRNKARKAQYTYIIAPDSERKKYSSQLIDAERAQRLIELQKKYFETNQQLEVQGYIGVGPRAVPVRWTYTIEGANIAAMQQILSFPRSAVETEEQLKAEFQPTFEVFYTPNLKAEGMPGEQAILVDLENYKTYVIGPDYFGESKKGALRMLCAYVYRNGGLVLHAGAKSVVSGDNSQTVTIMGLSGTGKTTTTFSKQGDLTHPIQDDMVAIWPEGECSITENGCFAKTAGLDPRYEPVIHEGTTNPKAWVENVYQDRGRKVDFAKRTLSPQEVSDLKEAFVATGASIENINKYVAGEVKAEDVISADGVPEDGWDFVVWTQNGRSIIPMSLVEDVADFHNLPRVESMGILNRDEGADAAMPAVVRFRSPEQAAGYFMLGETSKTSAAGKERGKTRSPFTQPFFPLSHQLQATRFSELVATMPGVTTWLMNTGYVGGDQQAVDAGQALKVKIRHSSAILEALLANKITWKVDPDFNYDIVDVDSPDNAELLKAVPKEILNPVTYYQSQGRMDEYKAWVSDMKTARRKFLEKFGVAEEIIKVTV